MSNQTTHPLIRLPRASVRVTDADEEIFLLYTRLASRSSPDGSHKFTGLGSVDSKTDTLTVTFKLPGVKGKGVSGRANVDKDDKVANLQGIKGRKRRHKNSRSGRTGLSPEGEVVEVDLVQDKTTLRSRKGDTGSVLWRVSVELGQLLLRQFCAEFEDSLFDQDELSVSRVLELGAGTGLLGILLSPWVEHYTITDLEYLTPLIQKNMLTNKDRVCQIGRRARTHRHANHSPDCAEPNLDNTSIEALDWTRIENMKTSSRKPTWPLQATRNVDLVVAVDCIYNPSLIPAFLDTLEFFASCRTAKSEDAEGNGNKTGAFGACVLVAVELRSEEVLREFLQQWLGRGTWEVWRIEWEEGETGLDVSFAVWVGWKTRVLA